MTTKTNRTRTQRMKILITTLFGAAVVVAIVGGLATWTPLLRQPAAAFSAPAPAAPPQAERPRPTSLLGTISAPKCDGGYNIVGSAVTIRNEKNEVVASTTTNHQTTGGDGMPCVANFFTTIPKAKFYQIKIGTHDGPSFSYEDLVNQNFSVKLDLK